MRASRSHIPNSLPTVKTLRPSSNSSMMAHSSTVSSKGQITLPKRLRERHHLKEGESVLILDSSDGIVIRHGRSSLRGMLRDVVDSTGFEKDIRKLRSEWII